MCMYMYIDVNKYIIYMLSRQKTDNDNNREASVSFRLHIHTQDYFSLKKPHFHMGRLVLHSSKNVLYVLCCNKSSKT